MPPKKTTNKVVAAKPAKTTQEVSLLQKFGQGILKFFEMLFDFILALLKVLPEFLKAVAWVIIASILAAFIAVIVVYFAFSVFGVKDSEEFQAYRDVVVGKLIEEYDLVEFLDDSDNESLLDFNSLTEDSNLEDTSAWDVNVE